MTARERFLAMTVIVLLVVGGGLFGGYMLIYSPLQEKNEAAEKLQSEVDDLEGKVRQMEKNRPQVALVKRQSLPPDAAEPNKAPTYNFARAEYKRLIERLLLQARLDGRPTSDRILTKPATPEMAPKKPAYTALVVQVEINKADLWQIADFLYGYYQIDLLHQITDIKITRENRTNEGRAGLKVALTTEAIILDGVEHRTSLIPVASAVAAVAGNPGVQAVASKPHLVHLISRSQALAARERNYSYIPLRDPFYGAVPPYVPEVVRPLEIAKIDDVRMGRDGMPKEIRFKLTGDGAAGASVVATATGSLVPEGDLTVDSSSRTIAIPAVEPDAPDSAWSKVEITATTAQGKTAKGSFAVLVEKSIIPPKAIVDISSAIRLVIVSLASDGTARATIKDNANPFRYEIEATAKGIVIRRAYQLHGKKWDEEGEYRRNGQPGILVIKDEETSTRRTFKVIAIEHNALIVCDISGPEPIKVEAKLPAIPGTVVPGMGFRPPAAPPRQGKADPLAAVAGNLAIAMPTPTYYRWVSGKSLKELLDPDPKKSCKIPPEEVKEILRRVKAEGPVSPGLLSAGNE